MTLSAQVLTKRYGDAPGYAAVLLTFARSLGFYFALLGVPFSWPPAAVLQIGAVLAIVFSAVLGLAGAFLPAWRVRRMAPYALIQTEGR